MGLKRELVIGKTNMEVLPPDLVKLCDISDREVIEKQASVWTFEVISDDQGKRVYY